MHMFIMHLYIIYYYINLKSIFIKYLLCTVQYLVIFPKMSIITNNNLLASYDFFICSWFTRQRDATNTWFYVLKIEKQIFF